MALAAYSYSSTNPDLPNSNTGQDLMSEVLRPSILEFINEGTNNRDLAMSLPQDILSIFNPHAISMMRAMVRVVNKNGGHLVSSDAT